MNLIDSISVEQYNIPVRRSAVLLPANPHIVVFLKFHLRVFLKVAIITLNTSKYIIDQSKSLM